MALPPPRTLSTGVTASFVEDPFIPGTFQLIIDGTPQSHINPNRPDELFFEYVRRIGHVIDHVRPAGSPITALHLGGGAYTLPRYIEATRPGSSQQVIELEGELVDFVRESFPLPSRAKIRVRRGDARERLDKLPNGLVGKVDLVVVDVFSGATIPAHLTTVEFYGSLQRFLAEGAAVAVNAADGSGLHFVRSQVATLREVFGEVVAIAEPQVLRGRRFGNVVLVAHSSATTTRWDWLPRLLAGGPYPARMLEGDELVEFERGLPPVTDSTAVRSPLPPQHLFGEHA